MTPANRIALKVSAIYGLCGFLWIAFSDQLVFAVAPDTPVLQTIKGWLYVVLTAVLLYGLINYFLKQQNRREKDFFRQLDALPHAVFRTDAKGQLLNVSGAYQRVTGIKLFNSTSTTWMRAIHPQDQGRIIATWDQAIGKGKPYRTEFRMQVTDGSYRFFESQGTPIYNESGDIAQWIGTIIDVHERKRAELELAEKEANLRLAVEGGNIGFWDWNISGNTVSYSTRWKAQLGLDNCDVPGSLDFFQNLLHPNDLDNILELKQQIEANPEGRYCIEYRIAHSDGGYRWMLSPATIIKDENGAAVRLLGANIDITERKEAERQLEHQATHDDLLLLPNRRLMERILDEALKDRHKQTASVGLIVIDIDDLKAVNDSLGHETGDEVLRIAAERIGNCIGETRVLCRPSGDELVVIVREGADRESLSHLAECIQRAFSSAFRIGAHRVYVTATLGISLYPEHANTTEQLLRYANAALHKGKRRGKNCVQFFDPGIAGEMYEWNQIRNALQHALQADELSVVFQPQIALSSGRIIGFEALARWLSPELGQVPPERFIPVAEASGMIDAIGEFVFTQAIALVAGWTKEERNDTRVAVNISARQLHQNDFAQRTTDMVRQAGLSPSCFELEITETAIMTDIDHAAATLNELTQAGFTLSIDDFGTGYSSLGYLQKLRVGALKIDRSFLQDVPGKTASVQIVEAIIALAHNLGIKVVAEGVETADQVAFLKRNGCEAAQGYLFSRPVPARQVARMLRRGGGNIKRIVYNRL